MQLDREVSGGRITIGEAGGELGGGTAREGVGGGYALYRASTTDYAYIYTYKPGKNIVWNISCHIAERISRRVAEDHCTLQKDKTNSIQYSAVLPQAPPCSPHTPTSTHHTCPTIQYP